MIHEAIAQKLIVYAVAGKPDEAEVYAGHVLSRGTDLMPLRNKVMAACSPEFREPILRALPWLSADRFGRLGNRPDPNRDIRKLLDDAGPNGLPRAELTDAEMEEMAAELVDFSQPTGGRPKAMVRLREHDQRFNLFARAHP